MSEMVERAIKAVEQTRIDGYGTDEEIARAVIAAMREPTDQMIMAVLEPEGTVYCCPENYEAVKLDWQRMIDRALVKP